MWESATKGTAARAFTPLDDSDDLKPLGHDVSVQGGGGKVGVGEGAGCDGGGEEGVEMPRQGISVKTEVILSTSDRLFYNDRLF